MAFNQPEEFIFLGTQTASSSASLSFTSLITSQYPVYYIKVRNILPATNSTTLLMTFSTDNGSTYLNSNYLWSNYHYTSNAVPAQTVSSSDSSISLTDATVSNTSSTNGVNMNIFCYGFGQSLVPCIQGNGGYFNSSSFSDGIEVGGMNSGSTPVTAIKFAFSSGNIAAGNIYLYGVSI